MTPQVILVTGGARSGKSSFALERALTFKKRVFIATAIPFDDEMKLRIGRHRAERADKFETIEAPLDVAAALCSLPAGTEVVLIDCLTVWLGNLMSDEGEKAEWFPQLDEFLATLKRPPCNLIIVTNEVGMGIVPAYPLGRHFRDIAGTLNRRVAALATHVVLTVSGIPVTIKGNLST
ncbi:MAG: bifunctional adenosylcobinamide kinase/adenosylcobinamide-phosphate guanylyltransferase [Lentisphaerae bacterium]|jgi:adenosylcobinamide kinase/adenosylcobinamide-phosphate guanylyltransferase|nr:bifunctional adenosylcobinamide kinase/adenosylcobinamide-phosphate guanylyltransferase [Lentisphaerota bacterium]